MMIKILNLLRVVVFIMITVDYFTSYYFIYIVNLPGIYEANPITREIFEQPLYFVILYYLVIVISFFLLTSFFRSFDRFIMRSSNSSISRIFRSELIFLMTLIGLWCWTLFHNFSILFSYYFFESTP